MAPLQRYSEIFSSKIIIYGTIFSNVCIPRKKFLDKPPEGDSTKIGLILCERS